MSADEPIDPKKDPIVQAQVTRSLKPYLHVATPAVLAAMRESLEELLTTHPDAVGMIKQLRARAARDTSAKVTREGEEANEDKQSGETGEDDA